MKKHDELILRNRLKSLRTEKSITQKNLAYLLGAARQMLSSIETGQLNSSAELALDKPFEDLFYFDLQK